MPARGVLAMLTPSPARALVLAASVALMGLPPLAMDASATATAWVSDVLLPGTFGNRLQFSWSNVGPSPLANATLKHGTLCSYFASDCQALDGRALTFSGPGPSTGSRSFSIACDNCTIGGYLAASGVGTYRPVQGYYLAYAPDRTEGHGGGTTLGTNDAIPLCLGGPCP